MAWLPASPEGVSHSPPHESSDAAGWRLVAGSPLQPQMLKCAPASRWHAREAAPHLERALLSSWALGKEGGQPSGRRVGCGTEPGRRGDIAPPAAAPGPCRLVQSRLLSSWTTGAASLFLGTALVVYWCEQAAEVSPLGVGASMAGVLLWGSEPRWRVSSSGGRSLDGGCP